MSVFDDLIDANGEQLPYAIKAWARDVDPTIGLVSGKEDVANKSDDDAFTANSTTLYPTQRAAKAYVDAHAAGLVPKVAVRLATAAALPTNTYSNGSSGVGATLTATGTGVLTVDGVNVALNDRLLVKDESNASHNGIYLCTTAGAVGVSYVLTRATDTDTGSEIKGAYVLVTEGTVNGSLGYVNVNTSAPTMGSTDILFGQFSAPANILAGNGLTKTFNTLSIDTAITADLSSTQTLTNKTLTSPVINTPTGIVKGDVGLGNVSNNAQLTIANNLSDLASASTARTNLGLGNVDNTSDATKNAAAVSLTNKKLGSLTSNGFVKTSGGDGTLSVDTSTYLTGNQTITLSGDVSGSGATSIATAIGAGKVTSTMLNSNVFANPSVSIGLTAVNGSAATAMRSDAAPALNQGIAPTWTGSHHFSLAINSDVASGMVLNASMLTTSNGYMHFGSTGTDAYFGVESSVGGTLITGAPGYAAFIRNDTGIALGRSSRVDLLVNSSGNTVVYGHALPNLTDTSDLGSATKLWRKGWLSELDAVLFAQNTVTLVGGWVRLTKNEGIIPVGQDVGTGDTTIDFGQSMTVNDFVEFRAAGAVEYVQVTSLSSGTRYNVDRNRDGSGSNAWPAGTVYSVNGNTGNGRIDLNANSTPRISLLSQGAAYNAQTELLRIGDLNGAWGYSSETYGFAVGDPSLAWVKIDSTNGVRLGFNTTTNVQIDASGNATFAGALSAATGTFAGSLSAATGSFSGTVTATAGAIGGFNIGADYLRDAANSFGLASTVTAGDDVRFWAGDTFANRTTAPFRLTEAGVLTATNANITGAINASSGSITGTLNITGGQIVAGTVVLNGSGITSTNSLGVPDDILIKAGDGGTSASGGHVRLQGGLPGSPTSSQFGGRIYVAGGYNSTTPAKHGRVVIGHDGTHATGDVIIGADTTPTAKLDVRGDVAITGVLLTGSGAVNLTDSAGHVNSSALNTVAIANGGTGSTSASAARAALGLAIGTDIEAFANSRTLQVPTLLNSWVNLNYSAGDTTTSAQAGYTRDRGWVALQGYIKDGATDVIFTLPSGYRPGWRHVFYTFNGARIDVQASGDVTFVSGSNAAVSLDGIGFSIGN